MELTRFEKEMLDGKHGEPRRFAMDQQLKVGEFFDAERFVEVSQVHLMSDSEATGNAGIELMEEFVSHGPSACRVLVPTVTDPCSVDKHLGDSMKQPAHATEYENRIAAALTQMGIMRTATCINYQTVLPPLLREHVAFGDTGSVIYANSVCGARSNFEGGSAALWAALTGRVPAYGFHLDERRRANRHFRLDFQPEGWTDWGALGALVGREMKSYWEVPVISNVQCAPTSDDLKHFGAALASFGSTPMFHIAGVTPEAATLEIACGGKAPEAEVISRDTLSAFFDSYNQDRKIDLVVFSAPQLSLFELQKLESALNGRKIAEGMRVFATTSPEVASGARRIGLLDKITATGTTVVEGTCFYQMYAREIGKANGWKRIATNSAKLSNIISGYGYDPVLIPLERCIETAVKGELA
ncbi:aconitase X [Leisingera daeponensis]|uniref:aconitase X n=1 Tax=Leisingera daeponensis TaxID=405746 RepID=UPI001C939BDF|nr:aconitase X catalytic domain-containing protein [Leisingera daeponensis]MBY6059406.1 aconitase X catalytic domain-containing protein [Leisingera daeponensis]